MFGALLGTLQKFRQEETKLKAKVKLIFKHLTIYYISLNFISYLYIMLIGR